MAMPERENIKIVSIGWKIMKKKPEFHGSDLEKIADYYHLDKEKIVLFGANVNPLGLSGQVKKISQNIWISSAVIQTEIILHFAAQFQSIVIFLLNSSCPEMVPAN